MRPWRALLIALGAMALGACTHYEAAVDGFASPAFHPALTHEVRPQDNAQRLDLAFAEASAAVTRALQSAGIAVVSPSGAPDVVVYLDYGIGRPRTQVTMGSAPVYGQTGSTSTTHVDVTPGGQVIATTTTEPTHGVVGYQPVPYQQTVYDRYLIITAIDRAHLDMAKERKQVWRVEVRSTGSSESLRTVLPYMIRAARPYLGQSTGKVVRVVVQEKDAETEFIRTGVGGPVRR